MKLKDGDKIEIYVYDKWRKAVVREEDGKLWAVGSDTIGNTKGFQIWIDGYDEIKIRLSAELDNDRLLDEFEEIANKYYDMLLKIHYKEAYFNKSQNERFHNFLQSKLITFVEKTGATDEQVRIVAATVVATVTDPNR